MRDGEGREEWGRERFLAGEWERKSGCRRQRGVGGGSGVLIGMFVLYFYERERERERERLQYVRGMCDKG